MDLTEFDPMELQQLRQWSQPNRQLTNIDLVSGMLGIADAVLFARFLFPRFVEVRGCVILADRYGAANFDEWWQAASGDRGRIERTVNHLHMWDVFESANATEERAITWLASVTAMSWRWAAETAFPQLHFQAVVSDDYGPTVELWVDRGTGVEPVRQATS